jgi:hypothetical protein
MIQQAQNAGVVQKMVNHLLIGAQPIIENLEENRLFAGLIHRFVKYIT